MSKKIIATVAALGITLLTQNAYSMNFEKEEILTLSDKQRTEYLVNKGIARFHLDDGQQMAFDVMCTQYENAFKELKAESNYIENEFRRFEDGESNIGYFGVKKLNEKTVALNEEKKNLVNAFKEDVSKEFNLTI